MDTDDLPESVDINFLTSIRPEHLDGHVPGLEHIFDTRMRVFTDEGDGKLPSCYLSRAKGKAKYVQPTPSDDDRPLDLEYTEDENDDGDENADVETSSDESQATFTIPSFVRVGRKWNEATAATGAVPITFENENDDEPFPLTLDNFTYREDTWEYGPGTCKPEDLEAFLVGCECIDNCRDPAKCECQHDHDGAPLAMYNKQGKFLFKNEGYEVTECNKYCSCKNDCVNRVAQRPRKVRMQIFKTKSNGWGVRVPNHVKKGTVLGMYTGRVVLDKNRNTSEVLDAARDDGYKPEKFDDMYSFNLDTRDHQEDVDDLKYYTVVSERTGNWTRFVNHSCDPNTAIYPVVYDIPVQSNCPHLVFVASRDIAPFNEITIDYNPGNAGSKRKTKKGGVECMCKAKSCRKRIWF